MEGVKTAAQIGRENETAAQNLPIETKRKFWKAMTKDGMNLGEAREFAGIELGVAAQLVIQCHTTIHLPMAVDEIE